ncbi:MAG: trypsin-like peptidase domain-containing protein [Alphaproteobacteria bacterium]
MRTGCAILAILLFTISPAIAFPAEVVESVVSVLPEWPDGDALPERPEGSGTVVLPGGYIATNVHVLGRATAINVRLHDGRILAAEIIGRDPPTDIALLKIDMDLALLVPGPEPALGDKVCALGNPFGLGLSLSCGVVSALHRTGTGFNPMEDFIQTDAAVNPGGSGGARSTARAAWSAWSRPSSPRTATPTSASTSPPPTPWSCA